MSTAAPIGDDEWINVPLVVRAARRDADMSQADLARRVGLSQAAVAGYETGSRRISVGVLELLLRQCGWRVLVLDGDGVRVSPAEDSRRDRGGRRYPAHLDVRRTGRRGDWWGDYYPGVWGVPERPVWTFHLDRSYRDVVRGSSSNHALGLPSVDDASLLEIFDTQIRRVPEATPGFRAEVLADPAPMIWVTPEDQDASWGGGVFWCDLDEDNADAAIAATIEHFRPLGREIEWKYYAYDRPADLTDRLSAAGFEAAAEEALVIGQVSDVRRRLGAAPEPVGITFRRMREDPDGAAADWQGVNDLHRAVWGEDSTGMSTTVAAAIAADPSGTSMWLALADDAGGEGTVVCAARVNFHEGTDFASMWGGSTLEEYRGRGIYKALVSRRADEAAARGFRYLQVDASPDSRPILERLGLRTLTWTTPWMWRP